MIKFDENHSKKKYYTLSEKIKKNQENFRKNNKIKSDKSDKIKGTTQLEHFGVCAGLKRLQSVRSQHLPFPIEAVGYLEGHRDN